MENWQVARLYCNAHELLNADGSDSDMGFGIFPSGCLANHSCDPNATWFLQDGGAGTAAEGGALLCVRALRAVAPGEPLSVAYCDVHEHRRLRQKSLQKSFLFSCVCPRCALPTCDSRADEQLLSAWKPGKKPRDYAAQEDRWLSELDALSTLISRALPPLASESMAAASAAAQALGESLQANLECTHALWLKLQRAQLRLESCRSRLVCGTSGAELDRAEGGLLRRAEISDALAQALERVFDRDRLLCDLRYGHCLLEGARARNEQALAGAPKALPDRERKALLEAAHAGARKALRVYATVLGSSHWMVAKVKQEAQEIADRSSDPMSG